VSRFIAIANQKGGVGKTTTTVNLAASLARFGQRVLVLDMDPQGNTSSGLGVQANALHRGIYEVLTGSMPVEEAITSQASPGVDLLPSGQRLIGAEVELVSALARERILEKSIHSVRDKYDILLADCPPSLGLLTVNTLTAADTVLIPMQCEYYALEGLTQLLNTINLIQQALNPRLEIEGILLTMFDARLNLSHEVAEETRKFFPSRVYETIIPRNVRLSEAPSFGKPVLEYDPECAGAQFYLKLAREVLRLPADATPIAPKVHQPEAQAAMEHSAEEAEPVHAGPVAITEEAVVSADSGVDRAADSGMNQADSELEQSADRGLDETVAGAETGVAPHDDPASIALDRDALEVAAIAAALSATDALPADGPEKNYVSPVALDEGSGALEERPVVLEEELNVPHDVSEERPVIVEEELTVLEEAQNVPEGPIVHVEPPAVLEEPHAILVEGPVVLEEELNVPHDVSEERPVIVEEELTVLEEAQNVPEEPIVPAEPPAVFVEAPPVLEEAPQPVRVEDEPFVSEEQPIVLSTDDLAEDVLTLPEESIVLTTNAAAIEVESQWGGDSVAGENRQPVALLAAPETIACDNPIPTPEISNPTPASDIASPAGEPANETPYQDPEPPPSVHEPDVPYTELQPMTEHDAHHPQEELVSHD
jgi:chromosome partitioning protein